MVRLRRTWGRMGMLPTVMVVVRLGMEGAEARTVIWRHSRDPTEISQVPVYHLVAEDPMVRTSALRMTVLLADTSDRHLLMVVVPQRKRRVRAGVSLVMDLIAAMGSWKKINRGDLLRTAPIVAEGLVVVDRTPILRITISTDRLCIESRHPWYHPHLSQCCILHQWSATEADRLWNPPPLVPQLHRLHLRRRSQKLLPRLRLQSVHHQV